MNLACEPHKDHTEADDHARGPQEDQDMVKTCLRLLTPLSHHEHRKGDNPDDERRYSKYSHTRLPLAR